MNSPSNRPQASSNSTSMEETSTASSIDREDEATIDDMFGQILGRLHQTHDAVDPALRQETSRRHVQFIAGASVKLNFILIGAVLLLGISNVFLGWHATHPDRQYFAADNGRIFPMIPMSQPYRKTADVIQYAKENVTRSFTMDFLNWRQQLEDVRPGYTRDGFKSFLEALKASGVLDTVKGKRMNMSISAGTGVLTKEGTENGVYQWIVELPIEVRLEGQTTRLPAQRFLTTVRIERVPTLDSIEGIGIGQLVTSPL